MKQLHKFYSEEKDQGVKSQLGNILFLQMDKISKTPDPIHFGLVEVIRATHQKIHEIFDDKHAFLVAWLTENMQFDGKDLPELKGIQSLFNEMKKYHIESLQKSAVSQEPKLGIADIIKGTSFNSVELLQTIINYELNTKIQQLQVMGNKIESFQPVKNDTISPSPSEEKQIDELPPPPYELNDESPPPYEYSLVTSSGASIPLLKKEKEEDLPPAYRPSQPDSKRPSKSSSPIETKDSKESTSKNPLASSALITHAIDFINHLESDASSPIEAKDSKASSPLITHAINFINGYSPVFINHLEDEKFNKDKQALL